MAGRGTRTRVVICGGGTAGWLAAAALSRQLGPLLDVTLVESEAIGTVGVGESTIPTARTFHTMAGVDERDFLRAARATFKLGISFEDWGAIGDRYIHSFGEIGRSTWMGGFQHMWLQARADGLKAPLDDYCFELRAAKEQRFSTGESDRINYAYHLDAVAYAAFLRTLCEARGVKRIEGRILEVRHAHGLIEAVRLEDGRDLAGDFFIDCTGFSALLIGKALGADWEDWSEWLATDSAQALQTAATEPARPYTRAIAHRAGWRWKIPLQHRVGNGLVYDRAEMSDDEARALLMDSVEGEVVSESRVIRYSAGRRRDVWRGNCVALGLSSGFVEPLESTSIHLIMIGVTRLLQMFPFNGPSPALAKRYNDLARSELERIRDFVVLHYHLTRRGDSAFWRRMQTMGIPETLRERMALFREQAHAYQGEADLFRVDSWVQVLLGQGLEPAAGHRMGALFERQQLRQALADLERNIAAAVARLPSHQVFLDRYLAA